jgi:hypothetical protein
MYIVLVVAGDACVLCYGILLSMISAIAHLAIADYSNERAYLDKLACVTARQTYITSCSSKLPMLVARVLLLYETHTAGFQVVAVAVAAAV